MRTEVIVRNGFLNEATHVFASTKVHINDEEVSLFDVPANQTRSSHFLSPEWFHIVVKGGGRTQIFGPYAPSTPSTGTLSFP